MKEPIISIIAAIDEKRGIGYKNRLLFSIPEDMKRFRKITLNHSVIMGRKTFESIGKPLPRRINIVVTRNKAYKAHGCLIANSLKEAIKLARQQDKKEIFIIGGGQIYRQAIEIADKLYLTLIKGKYKADTFFPDYSEFKKVIFKKRGEYKKYHFIFLELER